MRQSRDEVVLANAPIHQVNEYITESLHRLQQTRLEIVKQATLEDLFRDRNPYYLRATGQAAHQLMRHVLDSYLAIVDEGHFATFQRESAIVAERYKLPQPEPSAIIERFAPKKLPLRFEILEEYVRAYNRLTRKFFLEFCDDDALIDWERLTQFIVRMNAL